MRDENGKAFSLKNAEKTYETQRLGGGMVSNEQIISVSASKIVGDTPIAGSLANGLSITKQDGTEILFDGAEPESISLTKVDATLSASSENAVSNKAVMGGLNEKASINGQYASFTAGKVINKLTFAGAVTGTYDGSAAVTITIPEVPTVPTKTSQLTNDSGFITSVPSEYITEAELTSSLAPYLKSADADTVYVKTADLAGAINSAITTALGNYYTKSEADDKFEPKATPTA